MKLAIISHTEHYKDKDGTIVGWGPTVSEIIHLLNIFDEIYHVAMLHDSEAPLSAIPYKSDKIKFVTIPVVGGKSVLEKLNIVWRAPQTMKVVRKTLRKVDYFQLRTPTGIGVYLIPYLTFFSSKKGWYKFAGNWNQKSPPIGYAIQRYLLKKQKRFVTINGQWENQPKHCISFENPCLSLQDINRGLQVLGTKSIEGKLVFCFVGRLETPKGVGYILEAFKLLYPKLKSRVEVLHFVGDGTEAEYFKELAKTIDIPVIFHGFLSRDEVFEIYEQSHVFLLPSTASEGFPKVIAEAMNFGCIPVVSNVSAIGQYIEHCLQGFILKKVTTEALLRELEAVFGLSQFMYLTKLESQRKIIGKFNYDHYNTRIKNMITKMEFEN